MTIALTNTNVVDVKTGTVARDVAVLIDGDRIAAITTEVPAGARSIDTGGAFVVPGYNDMHAHALELADPSGAHELMLAFGITGYRQMSGSAALLAKRQAGGFAESASAPSLLHLPGELLTPLNASTAADVAATIRAQHEQGADFIKMGLVSGEIYPAAQAEANRVGIPLGGHLPSTTMAEDASNAGIRFIEHLGPGLGLLASCATNEDAIRAELAAVKAPKLPSAKLPGMAKLFSIILARIVVNPQLMTSAETVGIMRKALDSYSDERAEALAALLVANETWQCPTLIREKTNERGDDAGWADDENLRFMSPKTQKLWHKTAKRASALPETTRSVFHDLYDAQKRLALVLANASVPLLAGSDVTGASWEIPGASLHQEFDELAAAGLSPLQVLQATTSAPARFVGRTDFGAVEVDARADLVLLGADPTQNVSALHAIVGVVRNGVHRSEAELTAIKERIALTHAAG
ncbi:amidohydrolase family protein [Subtercola lobariae]|uniref:Amidohydrolase n=1 Tax=Subtercola lobariae TaxID=1588641 RepID=A0A917EVK5_9MICO|nr:amidohydrolase family protein [Subtercola lobariae]GGF22565.1 amidohydrolase [Subtercola lobariae]